MMSMRRLIGVLALGTLLVWVAGVAAAEEGPVGNWKLSFFMQGQQPTPWLVRLEHKGGEWVGEVLAVSEKTPKTTLENLRVRDGEVHFDLRMEGQRSAFEGRLDPKQPGRILGSLGMRSDVVPAELEKTSLESLDSFDVARETIARHTTGARAVEAARALVEGAEDHKATAEQVEKWAQIGLEAAKPFGRTLQRAFASSVAENLADSEKYQALALKYAGQAEKLLQPDDAPYMRKRVLETLASLLTKAGKTAEARQIEAALDRIRLVKISTYPGRKPGANQAVLVELFTGTQCPPCVAADIAFESLGKTFRPSDAILLEYDVHIPGADPLANPDSLARMDYYGQAVEGTPTLLLNGKAGPEGGGDFSAAQDTYNDDYRAITPLLEGTAQAKIEATAVRKQDTVQVDAKVSGLEQPGTDVRLRLALVEEQIYYRGPNRVAEHHHVLRTFAGGTKGIPLAQEASKHSVSVDLAQVRKDLESYLASYASENGPFPGTQPAVSMKNLLLVAFVQNDKTKQVLQAVQVPVTAAREAP